MSSIKWLLEELGAFAFTDVDKQHLADLLAQSYLLAKAQAYQKAIASTQHVVTIHQPWQPGESDVRHAQQWANGQVESIVSTYEEMLQHAIEQMSEEPQEAIDDVIGHAKKKAKDLVSQIAQWFLLFLPWKTKQIAHHTWSTGGNDGVNEFIEEIQRSEKSIGGGGDGTAGQDNGGSDDTGGSDNNVEGDTSVLRVKIVPAESSSDFCADYAGKTFSLNDTIPDFPAHPFCRHGKKIIIVNARNAEESILADLLSESEVVS